MLIELDVRHYIWHMNEFRAYWAPHIPSKYIFKGCVDKIEIEVVVNF